MAIKKTTNSRGGHRFRVYVHDATVHRQVYVGTFDRRKDAVEAEYEAKRRLRLGERLKPREEITFDALSDRWLAGLVSARPSTRKDYDKAVRRLRPFLSTKLVSTITRRDIDDMIAAMAQQYAASTTRKTIVVMKMILRTGVDHGYLDGIPTGATRLALPKTKRRVFEPLTPAQVKKLVSSTPEYYRPLIQTLLTTGLRGSEARGLRIADVDLEHGVLHVRGQLINNRIEQLKTDSSYRDVPIPKQTVECLRSHIASVPSTDLGLLFPTAEGKPINPSNFYGRVWIPTREAAGLPNLRMHDLRHHVASVYLAQGRSVTYVQRLLGHSDPSTLLSIYSWVTRDEADIATSDFERWLGEEIRAIYRIRMRVA